MSRFKFALPLMISLLLLPATGSAQRGGPPRRVKNPETIQLPGGGTVEFREFESKALGEDGRYSILLPASYHREPERVFPVIFFLHGMNNDHTSWTVDRYGNLPETVEKLISDAGLPPFIMVHPDGQTTFYTDSRDGTKRSEEFIYRDLLAEVEKNFRVRSDRNGRALAGTSMGGYGALKIAFKHPKLYGAVAAGSPIILLGDDPSQQILKSPSQRAQLFAGLFEPLFGIPFDPELWKENSIEALAASRNLENLGIYVVYGTADRYQNLFPMEEGIRTLESILSRRGIEHTLKIYEGEPHGWELIQSHLEEILAFLTQRF